jgi:transposase, IS30 family
MPQKYLQLTYSDRLQISHWNAQKKSVSEIARRLGVHKSTISRELRRNARTVTRESQLFFFEMSLLGHPKALIKQHLKEIEADRANFKDYSKWQAMEAQRTRQHRMICANQLRRRKSVVTRAWVVEKLKSGWSPKQIAGRSSLETSETVSYEYVYRLIHENKKRGGKLHRLLPRYGKRKQRFGSRSYPDGPIIPQRVDIQKRPKIVEKRSRLGDLEGDLIQGYLHSGYILSLIDRKSRYVTLRKLKTKRKKGVRVELERAMRKMKFKKTLTLDNGSEFCDHQELTRRTRVPVYFATPYRSCERGPNENTNGLVRRFLPKKTRFTRLTQTRLNEIANLMNHRPRACLGYLTPHEVQFNKRPKIISKHQPLHFRSNSAPAVTVKITLPLEFYWLFIKIKLIISNGP